jgi:hypothetical protein
MRPDPARRQGEHLERRRLYLGLRQKDHVRVAVADLAAAARR